MSDHTELLLKRNRGWPWPESSFGKTPMFGEDGWCRSCGVPNRPQYGSIVLQRKGLARVDGAWVPHWQYDAICLEQSLAGDVQSRFDVELRQVAWAKTAPGAAMQIVAPTVGDAWFDPDELGERVRERHGRAGAECPNCGVWRWLPRPFRELPPVHAPQALASCDVAASPEWFGDGSKAFRQILVRRELAETIVGASPRDFSVQEIAVAR